VFVAGSILDVLDGASRGTAEGDAVRGVPRLDLRPGQRGLMLTASRSSSRARAARSRSRSRSPPWPARSSLRYARARPS
jgi:hypothetical protein